MEQTITLPHHKAPSTSFDFDKSYNWPITFLGDSRVPTELKTLLVTENPKTALEIGCGVGRFSKYVAKQGVKTTGIDFSAVAIEKANNSLTDKNRQPTFLVGDATSLPNFSEPFDVSFDVGCFHGLNFDDQQKYIKEMYQALKPGATHLIWAIDNAPSEIKISPEYMAEIFGDQFRLSHSAFSRRRLVASHWYWLTRRGPSKSALHFTL